MDPPAETIILRCIRELQEIPEADLDAAWLMDIIAHCFLNSSHDDATTRRRAWALLRIAAEGCK